MKQPEDKYTVDMHGEVITLDNSKPTYRFFIKTGEGATLAWSGLTQREAKLMHKLMDKFNPLQSNVDVIRCGWEEVQ